jgi:hypothetical protein
VTPERDNAGNRIALIYRVDLLQMLRLADFYHLNVHCESKKRKEYFLLCKTR